MTQEVLLSRTIHAFIALWRADNAIWPSNLDWDQPWFLSDPWFTEPTGQDAADADAVRFSCTVQRYTLAPRPFPAWSYLRSSIGVSYVSSSWGECWHGRNFIYFLLLR